MEFRESFQKENLFTDPILHKSLSWLILDMLTNQVEKIFYYSVKDLVKEFFDLNLIEGETYDCIVDEKRVKIAPILAHIPVSNPEANKTLLKLYEYQKTLENRTNRVMSISEIGNAEIKAQIKSVNLEDFDELLIPMLCKEGIAFFAITSDKILANLETVPIYEKKVFLTTNDVKLPVRTIQIYDIRFNSRNERLNLVNKFYIDFIKYEDLISKIYTEDEVYDFLRKILNETLVGARMPQALRNQLIYKIVNWRDSKEASPKNGED